MLRPRLERFRREEKTRREAYRSQRLGRESRSGQHSRHGPRRKGEEETSAKSLRISLRVLPLPLTNFLSDSPLTPWHITTRRFRSQTDQIRHIRAPSTRIRARESPPPFCRAHDELHDWTRLQSGPARPRQRTPASLRFSRNPLIIPHSTQIRRTLIRLEDTIIFCEHRTAHMMCPSSCPSTQH